MNLLKESWKGMGMFQLLHSKYFDIIYSTIVIAWAMWVGTNVYYWLEDRKHKNEDEEEKILKGFYKIDSQVVQSRRVETIYPIRNKKQKAKNKV